VLFVGACNAVLGIDAAVLDEADGGAVIGPSADCAGCVKLPPGDQECAPNDPTECEDCINRSSQGAFPVVTCLGDPLCRQGLDNYRSCVERNDCTVTPTCSACLSSTGIPAATSIAQLVDGACRTECAVHKVERCDPLADAGASPTCAWSEVLSICDLYCSCMAQACPTKDVGPTCVETCRKNLADGVASAPLNFANPWEVHCRWLHCEVVAQGGLSFESVHCNHAAGDGACGTEPRSCLNKRPAGYPCDNNADCVSGSCTPMVCR